MNTEQIDEYINNINKATTEELENMFNKLSVELLDRTYDPEENTDFKDLPF